jgi:ABC-type polysaccharide/polyol phosphate transport system ATPase subunit
VEEGDVVGIVGKNGAGKSTLLKLMSKIVAPTTGFIYTNGRIGSLLEIGTGFHNEMTGRENIFMNGAILGMTQKEIKQKLDEIIDFSGCELYIDTPVKRYSQGMMVRLGFSVAAHLNPDILVVDEVLSIGDSEFPRKAVNKLKETNKNGGINGGITNGMPIIFRCSVKPTPSIYKPQSSVDLEREENVTLEIKGRHDPAIIHRARIVVDSIAALVLADMLTARYGADYLASNK